MTRFMAVEAQFIWTVSLDMTKASTQKANTDFLKLTMIQFKIITQSSRETTQCKTHHYAIDLNKLFHTISDGQSDAVMNSLLHVKNTLVLKLIFS